MDDHTSESAAVATPQAIPITRFNPLFGHRHMDTISAVRAVLSLLSSMGPTEEIVHSDRATFGLSLIHQWLDNTLSIAADYPDLLEVIPVLPKAIECSKASKGSELKQMEDMH